ncbi:MAG TPA: hypothetical protein VFF04_03295 [Candidatus Babeliales bacterium]|nr:hypothetical protein [Candidatus Babeliales bacterium]
MVKHGTQLTEVAQVIKYLSIGIFLTNSVFAADSKEMGRSSGEPTLPVSLYGAHENAFTNLVQRILVQHQANPSKSKKMIGDVDDVNSLVTLPHLGKLICQSQQGCGDLLTRESFLTINGCKQVHVSDTVMKTKSFDSEEDKMVVCRQIRMSGISKDNGIIWLCVQPFDKLVSWLYCDGLKD